MAPGKTSGSNSQRDIVAAAGRIQLPDPPAIEAQIRAIDQKIASSPEGFKGPLRFRWALAAVAAFSALMWIALWQGGPSTMETTAPGQSKSFALADGSQVILRGGSSLTWSKGFGTENRNLQLSGEAYFEVSSAEVPFVIDAGSGQIRVLGTRFIVRTRDNHLKVSVMEGQVQLTTREEGSTPLLLHGGSMALYQSGSPPRMRTFPADTLLPWQDGRILFLDEPMALVASDLAAQFAVNIRVDESLRNKNINASIQTDRLETILTLLCDILQAEWRLEDGAYLIQPLETPAERH